MAWYDFLINSYSNSSPLALGKTPQYVAGQLAVAEALKRQQAAASAAIPPPAAPKIPAINDLKVTKIIPDNPPAAAGGGVSSSSPVVPSGGGGVGYYPSPPPYVIPQQRGNDLDYMKLGAELGNLGTMDDRIKDMAAQEAMAAKLRGAELHEARSNGRVVTAANPLEGISTVLSAYRGRKLQDSIDQQRKAIRGEQDAARKSVIDALIGKSSSTLPTKRYGNDDYV